MCGIVGCKSCKYWEFQDVYLWGMWSSIILLRALLTCSQWQRAETLGALVNGVFLVALCLSIFLEAIQRFVEPQHVSNPKLVLIVGCFGLASNLLGLLLFHDHSHGGGGEEGHGHSHDEVSHAEEGHSHVHGDADDHAHRHLTDERGQHSRCLAAGHRGWIQGV